ncbi:MAG: hypothetical protein P8Z00_19420 [Anaerolineales bacterium]
MDDLFAAHLQHQVAAGVDRHGVAAGDGQADGAGVGAGGDVEVVFQLARFAVVDHVDAGIDAAADHPGVSGDAGVPLPGVIADVIIVPAGEGGGRVHGRPGWEMQAVKAIANMAKMAPQAGLMLFVPNTLWERGNGIGA